MSSEREPESFRVQVGATTYVVESRCPHRGGKLAYGHVNERRGCITCPLHGATFELASGRQLAGPACGPLRVRIVPGDW
ncbi:Rieske (2Fe-2S) protein [Sorangium sp. So ce1128]